MTFRIGVLISGRGSNLQALIDACAQPDYPVKIALVVSNEPEAIGLLRAESAGIDTKIIDHRPYVDRPTFEEAVTSALVEAGAELVCLAGFMRLLTNNFVERWRDRLINVHPSLLPAFKGVNVHERVIASGTKFTGCTVHFVRVDMDTGPIIVQSAVPVLSQDRPEDLAVRVLAREHECLPKAIRWIAEERIQVVNDVVEIRGAISPKGGLTNPSGTR